MSSGYHSCSISKTSFCLSLRSASRRLLTSHGFGWRILCGVEVIESSTNKQHTLYPISAARSCIEPYWDSSSQSLMCARNLRFFLTFGPQISSLLLLPHPSLSHTGYRCMLTQFAREVLSSSFTFRMQFFFRIGFFHPKYNLNKKIRLKRRQKNPLPRKSNPKRRQTNPIRNVPFSWKFRGTVFQLRPASLPKLQP